jgi:heme oxygenase
MALDQDDKSSVSDIANPPFTSSMYGKLMKQIHRSHKKGQSIRNVLLPVLLTSQRNYAAALVQFYFPTALLEELLLLHSNDPLIAGVLGCKSSFARQYEADLKELLGDNWQNEAEGLKKPATIEHCARLSKAQDDNDILTLVAAYFILHGPLVVGGGPALKPFVTRAFGDKVVHVLDIQDRVATKVRFKNFFNKIALESDQETRLIAKCGSFMELNNELLTQLDLIPPEIPSWLPLVAGTAALAAILYYNRGALSRLRSSD